MPRSSWQVGRVWKAETERGILEAVILAKVDSEKLVRMNYLTGPRKDRPIISTYSHRHLLKYFKPTEEIRNVEAYLNCKHEKQDKHTRSHCRLCGWDLYSIVAKEIFSKAEQKS